jgi:hypothetical protein
VAHACPYLQAGLPEGLLLSLKEPGRGTMAGQVPLRLLAEAVKQLQGRQAHQACELLLFYMQRCWAAAEAARSRSGGGSGGEGGEPAPGGGNSSSGSTTAASTGAPAGSSDTAVLAGSSGKSYASAAQVPAAPAAQHLAPEHAVWLLELVAASACLGCIHSKPGKPSPKDVGYLPQASFQMLVSLPIAAAELSLQLKQMQRVDGELMAATWQRLAVVLAATAQQLRQQQPAAPAGEELAGRLAVVCWRPWQRGRTAARCQPASRQGCLARCMLRCRRCSPACQPAAAAWWLCRRCWLPATLEPWWKAWPAWPPLLAPPSCRWVVLWPAWCKL